MQKWLLWRERQKIAKVRIPRLAVNVQKDKQGGEVRGKGSLHSMLNAEGP
jgi:hypothetical protein